MGAATMGANAQSFLRDRNTSVQQRSESLFAPNGMEVGSFQMFPALTAGGSFDDNVRNTSTGEESSVIVYVAPGVRLDSNWGRHNLAAEADLSFREVLDASDQSTTDARFKVDGRFDIGRASEIFGGASQEWASELRSAQTSLLGETAVEPITSSQSTFHIGAAHKFNRLRLTGEVKQQNFDFDSTIATDEDGDTVRISQNFRDRNEQSFRIAGAFAWSPASSVFATFNWADVEYDIDVPGEQSRSGTRFTQTVGIDFDVFRAARGTASIGFQSREFDNTVAGLPQRDDTEALNISTNVEWFATPIITAEFGLTRDIGETGLFAASSSLNTRAYARADYELRRNLILSGEIARGLEEFEDFGEDNGTSVDREDDVFEVSFGGVYQLNRFVGVEAVYRRFERDISFPGADADTFQDGEIANNSFAANLVLRY